MESGKFLNAKRNKEVVSASEVLIPLESGKFLNIKALEAITKAICLNPFGVREVSKRITSRIKFKRFSLNPFGVREVSKLMK